MEWKETVLFGIRASVELEIIDFVTIENIIKLSLFIWRNPPLSIYLSLFLFILVDLWEKKLILKKKNIFPPIFIRWRNDCIQEKMFSSTKKKKYVIKNISLWMKKTLTRENHLSEKKITRYFMMTIVFRKKKILSSFKKRKWYKFLILQKYLNN